MSKTDDTSTAIRATDDHQMHETDTVLIVDDDAGIRDLLEFKLDGHGFDIATAPNGAACLSYLEEEPLPRAILLDVMMPYTNGLEVLERIREEFSEDLPVVLLTATESVESDEERPVVTERIQKPFRVAEVRECLETLFDEQ